MISAIRKQLMSESLRYTALIAVIALLVGFIVPDLMRSLVGTGEWIIRVNKQEISAQQFARRVAQEQDRIAMFREQMSRQYGQEVADAFMNMQGEINPNVLAQNYLITDELLHQVSRQIGIHLDEDYIIQKLSDPNFIMQEHNLIWLIPPYVFDELGQVNEALLKAHLRRYGLTVADFEQQVKRVLIQKITNELMATASYVPDFDLKQQFSAHYVPKKFSILTFSFDTVLNQEKKKQISDNEVQAFFDRENNKNKRYWVPEERSGVVWTFNPESFGLRVSDGQIERKYGDDKVAKYIDQPTKVQVRKVFIPVTSQAEREAAKNKAEKERTALLENPSLFEQKGELVPFFARGEKEKPFEMAAFLLENDGDISQVIETEEGYVILQRVAKKMRTFKPLSSVRHEIKKELIDRKFSDSFLDQAWQVVVDGVVNKQELNDFVRLKKATTKKLVNVLAADSSNAKRLFSLRLNNAVFYIDDNKGVIIQLDKITPSYLPEFNAIKTTVKNDLYEKRAEKKLNELLEKAKKQTKQQSIQSAHENLGGSLETTEWLRSEDKELVEKLQKRGIPVYEMLQIEKIGSMMVHADENIGFIIVLNQLKPLDEAEFNEKKEELRNQLESERIQQLSSGFVASLHRNATIETSEMLTQLT